MPAAMMDQLRTHLRRLRDEQGISQDLLAARSDLSADTIRRIERGNVPYLHTFMAVCKGLRLRPSTVIAELEDDGQHDAVDELADLLRLRIRDPRARARVIRIVRVLIEEFADQ